MTTPYEEHLRIRRLGEQFAAIVEPQFTIDSPDHVSTNINTLTDQEQNNDQ